MTPDKSTAAQGMTKIDEYLAHFQNYKGYAALVGFILHEDFDTDAIEEDLTTLSDSNVMLELQGIGNDEICKNYTSAAVFKHWKCMFFISHFHRFVKLTNNCLHSVSNVVKRRI